MGGKASPPAPPDYSGVAAASEKSAELSYKYGQEQLAWAREQYASDREITDKVVNMSMDMARQNQTAAMEDRARYKAKYQGLEDKLISEAESYASPERRQLEVGKAQASVAQQFDQQRAAAMQNLQDYGVDPTSGRGQGIDTMMRTAQGAATAAAGNQATAMVDATGRALRSEAINIGKGYPGQIAGQYGTALQGGNLAVNSQLAATASGANTMGTAAQWQGLGNQAVGTWGNTLNQSYQNQLGAYNAANQGSSGWGSAIGAGLGLATKLLPMIAEGGTVPATDGGDVPDQASPTRGAAIDDVPARLTAGEFVVPKDVAAWKGEEFFQKMIDNSRKAKGEATAKPTMAIGVAEEPTYVSRPRASALPMG
jgi:hypothetical protein